MHRFLGSNWVELRTPTEEDHLAAVVETWLKGDSKLNGSYIQRYSTHEQDREDERIGGAMLGPGDHFGHHEGNERNAFNIWATEIILIRMYSVIKDTCLWCSSAFGKRDGHKVQERGSINEV